MRCERCKKRSCRLSVNHWRLLFFNFYAGVQVVCHDYEPVTYHGLEDVYE
jgi:hypothetical protein